jgi:hypothetical protein
LERKVVKHWIANNRATIRSASAFVRTGIGEDLANLNSTNNEVRVKAAKELRSFARQAGQVIPVLVRALTNSYAPVELAVGAAEQASGATNFEATVFELRVPENRVADLDARTLEAKAATAQSLLKTLEEVGSTKVLYRVDQTVNLFGESINIGTNEPLLTGTQTTPIGATLNTVTYHNICLTIYLSSTSPS